jgi:hypothetical protein
MSTAASSASGFDLKQSGPTVSDARRNQSPAVPYAKGASAVVVATGPKENP